MQNSKHNASSRVTPDSQYEPTSVETAVFTRFPLSKQVSLALRNSKLFRPAFDQIVADKMTMVAIVIAIYHFLLAICFATIPYLSAPIEIIQLNVTVGAVGFILFFLFRRVAAPPRFANLILTLLIMSAVMNALFYLSFSKEMRQSIFLLFVIVGASQFFLSTRWFVFNLVTILGAWFWVAWQLLEGSVFYFGFILAIGAATAVVIFAVRRDAHQRYEWLRMRDAQRRDVLQYRAAQLEKSQGIAQQIGSILDIGTLLAQVVDLIYRQTDIDYVNLYLLDGSKRFLELRASAGDDVETGALHVLELPVDESSLPGWVAENGRHRCTNNVKSESLFTPLIPNRRVQSQLDLPLQNGRQMLGVLSLQSRRPYAFDTEEVLYLKLLASQVANGIRNAYSYEREKSARLFAETLKDTGKALASTLEWDAIIDLILERLTELVPYDRAAVLVQKGAFLKFVAFRGFPPNSEPQNIHISLENESIFRHIVETKRPYALDDASDNTDWQAVESLPPARSWLGVPLLQGGEVIGMLSLTRESRNPYLEREIQLATAFAGQAAIALENARLYEETTRFNQQLEYEVKQRTEAIQVAYEELEELNRNKSDFISVVSHELRTPLTILHGYTQMLLQDKIVLENQMRRTLVKGIETGSERLADIINSMLDVVKIENQELNLYPSQLSVPAMAKMVVDDLFELLGERDLTIEVDSMADLPIVHADPDMLKKVFYHLLVNAVKYTPDGGTIRVMGQRYLLGKGVPSSSVEIIVKDSGIGIDSAMRELIFTKFYQTGEVSLHSSSKTQFKGGGPGLGLAIVKGIVEAHKGRIWVESAGHDENVYPGSEFHIVLPISNVAEPPETAVMPNPLKGMSGQSPLA